jgi:small subunit ribosomal protein S5
MAKQNDTHKKNQAQGDHPKRERGGDGHKRERSDGPKKDKVQSDVVEKVLYINRCSKVVKGGKKFSFSALILAGDGNGKVGYGFAKANELTDAIRKGGELARKNMRSFPMEGTTIPHEVIVKFDGVEVLMKPVPKGGGMIAGSKLRDVLELAGIKDVMAKNLRGNNPINMVKAVFKALETLVTRDGIKKVRGER